MIYTVTLNASIDYIATCDNFQTGKVNVASSENFYPGGKGINVSAVLKTLGEESVVLGFVGGYVGGDIKAMLHDMNVEEHLIEVEGNSRFNVKIESKEESEFNGKGPLIKEEDIQKLLKQLDDLKDGDVLVLSGSLPYSVSDDIYARIMDYVKEKDLLIVVDTVGQAMLNALKYKPFLIKPNNFELEDLFKQSLDNQEKMLDRCFRLQEMGARNIIVSLGEKGALMVKENGIAYPLNCPIGKVVNTIGSGDSLVAGFLHSYLKDRDYYKALMYGVCAGSATAFNVRFSTKEEIERLMKDTYNFR